MLNFTGHNWTVLSNIKTCLVQNPDIKRTIRMSKRWDALAITTFCNLVEAQSHTHFLPWHSLENFWYYFKFAMFSHFDLLFPNLRFRFPIFSSCAITLRRYRQSYFATALELVDRYRHYIIHSNPLSISPCSANQSWCSWQKRVVIYTVNPV